MKPFLLILGLAALASRPLNAQQVEWSANWGGDLLARFSTAPLLAADGMGNSYAACRFSGTIDMDGYVINGSGDILLVKFNDAGTVQWVNRFGEGTAHPLISDEDRPLAIAYDPLLDEVVVVGSYNTRLIFDQDTLLPGSDPEQYYLFIARFNSEGNCLWARRATSNGDNAQIIIDDMSALHIVANIGGTFQGAPDITVPFGGCHAVYSSGGDLLSAETFLTGGTLGGFCQLPNGKYVITFRTLAEVQLFGEPVELELGSGWSSAVVRTDSSWCGGLDIPDASSNERSFRCLLPINREWSYSFQWRFLWRALHA